jgi:hypothetical protein
MNIFNLSLFLIIILFLSLSITPSPRISRISHKRTKRTYKAVGDNEHVEILKLNVDDGLRMVEIGKKLNRSSRTP